MSNNYSQKSTFALLEQFIEFLWISAQFSWNLK